MEVTDEGDDDDCGGMEERGLDFGFCGQYRPLLLTQNACHVDHHRKHGRLGNVVTGVGHERQNRVKVLADQAEEVAVERGKKRSEVSQVTSLYLGSHV